MKSIAVVGGKEVPEKGDKLECVFEGVKIIAVVLENSPQEFRWTGSPYGLFVGEHSFQFEPSVKTPGGTRLVQKEEISGLLSFIFREGWAMERKMKAGFEGFNEDLKRRVEGQSKL